MKIAIDLRPLQNDHRFRGIGVHLQNLIECFSRIDIADEYTVFRWPTSDPLKELDLSPRMRLKEIVLPPPKTSVLADKIANIFRRQIRLKKSDADVFLQPDISYGRCKGDVPTIGIAYDLIELVFRDLYYPRSLLRLVRQLGFKHALGNLVRYQLMRWQLRELSGCARVVAISESTKRDLIKLNSVDPEKVTVSYLGYDTRHYKIDGESRRPPSVKKPYLLYIGGADFRKNVKALVETFSDARSAGHDLQLVLAGKDFGERGVREHADLWNAINSSEFRQDIITMGFVESEFAATLYRNAEAFIFPSLYEGFGIPLLEAMACGCPAVAFRNSSLPEVAGDAALLVEPEHLTSAVSRLLEDGELRQELVAKGLKRAEHFSWDKNAKEILTVLGAVI